MKAEQASFRSLVNEAANGGLQLPEFQRRWKWNRSQVLSLYDSVRKGFPIGSFLQLEASDELNLSPRLFQGVSEPPKNKLKSYVLDGQQRITAGIALYHGLGASHYFLDLGELWNEAQAVDLDFEDSSAVRTFAEELDEEEKYMKGRRRGASPETRLAAHEFWTPYLADDTEFSIARDKYVALFSERAHFMDRLIGPYFKLGAEPVVPVTLLDSGMSLEAITRVFETLNTTGSRLTPVEIVVAVLYSKGINLREELRGFQESKTYYSNVDTAGERYLQTITLLDGQNPKQVTLPKTITKENYEKHSSDGMAALELAGKFLSEHFGAGLDKCNDYIPYPAQLPPLGIALSKIDRDWPDPSAMRADWLKKIERWFVGSVLVQRYTQSQPRIQMEDSHELERWLSEGDRAEPAWLSDVRVPRLDNMRPSSAIGKLIILLQSRQDPRDPLNDELVGGRSGDIADAELHHVFPQAFCTQHIPDWNSDADADVALNTMPVTRETNRLWSKMDPANQINDVRNRVGQGVDALYGKVFINARGLEVMQKSDKRQADYLEFIAARGREITSYIQKEWGFPQDSNVAEDEEDE